MMSEEKEEYSNIQDLSGKLSNIKSLLEDGDNETAMQMLDECIAKLGEMEGMESAHAEGNPEEKSEEFKNALNNAFKE